MKDWVKKNGLEYSLIMESMFVHLYEVDGGRSYEVAHLVHQKYDTDLRKAGWYIPSNERFGGAGNFSKCFYNKDRAIKYYKKLKLELDGKHE